MHNKTQDKTYNRVPNPLAEYSLKRYALMVRIRNRGLTLADVAAAMAISGRELRRRLYLHRPFTKPQIRAFVYLMGAREAAEIIYFPSIAMKRAIMGQVFGQERGERQADER